MAAVYVWVFASICIGYSVSLKHSPYCATNQIVCFSEYICIPVKNKCDGHADCIDGSDELDCSKSSFVDTIPGVKDSLEMGRKWLIEQRKDDWSWGKDNNRAAVSLLLSEDDDLYLSNKDTQFIIMQMKIQLSELLHRKGITTFNVNEISFYINSLLASCSNPRDFHEFDLIHELKNRIQDTKFFNPVAALVICNSNETIEENEIMKLSAILKKRNMPYWIDYKAFALMALTCLKRRIKSRSESHLNEETISNSSYFVELENTKEMFTNLQKADGSFGNIYTTAVLMHALLSTESYFFNISNWDVKKAFLFLVSEQKTDGSFGDISATFLVLPLLNGKTFLDLGYINCSRTMNNFSSGLDTTDVKLRIYYSIFVGKDKDVSFELSLNIDFNSTLYDVMVKAASLDSKFRFKYIDYPGGKYVYSIFGLVNLPEERRYWQLYKLSENSSAIFYETPEKIILQDEDKYAYWYKSI